MELQTDRMVMRTNIVFSNGNIVIPQKTVNTLDILSLVSTTGQESGFIFYTNTGDEICHIYIETKRGKFELSYGTEECYRRNGYMFEALMCVLELLRTYAYNEKVYALVNDKNIASEQLLLKAGFTYEGLYDTHSKWYRYDYTETAEVNE